MKLSRTAPLALLGLLALASTARAGKTPACVRWWGQPVSTATGYNHVVGIENGCDRPVACVISTNVAPDPITASVPAKQKIELVTFRGSPSSAFTPKVECTLQ